VNGRCIAIIDILRSGFITIPFFRQVANMHAVTRMGECQCRECDMRVCALVSGVQTRITAFTGMD
jgi:hypothetical protein